MTDLSSLPLEIIHLVFKALELYTDRWALARTCNSYYKIGLPLAFESFQFYPRHFEPIDSFILLGKCVNPKAVPENILRHVKHIDFACPNEYSLLARNAHLLEHQTAFEYISELGIASVDISERFTSAGNELNQRFLTEIKKQILDVLAAIPEGRLESFSWQLRFCMPREICGIGGELPTRQKNLKELSIDTGLACGFRDILDLRDGQISRQLDIKSFDRLTSIMWKGNQSVILWTALRKLIALNHLHLCNLTVDISGGGPYDVPMNTDLLIRAGLELPSLRLISLRRTQLDFVTLGQGELIEKMTGSLPFASNSEEPSKEQLRNFQLSLRHLRVPQLESLTLVGCNEIDSFLERLLVEQHLSLQRLEIEDAEDDDFDLIEFPDSPALPEVLRRCDRLEELYLLLYRQPVVSAPGSLDQTRVTWDILNTQGFPLRRLVYHERSLEDEFGNTPADWIDFLDRQLIKEVLSKMELECFGICDLPHLMPPYLQAFRGKSTLKVLHIRRTYGGIDYRELREQDHFENPGAMWYEMSRFDPVDELRRCLGRQHPEASSYKLLTELVRRLFGKSGIDSLELIAYGDFADECRYKEETLLYVRAHEKPHGYREIHGVDPDWEKAREPWRDFLSTCPYSGNLEDSDLEDEEDSALDDDIDEEEFYSDSQFLDDLDDGWPDMDASDYASDFSDNDSQITNEARNEDDEGLVNADATDDDLGLRDLFAETASDSKQNHDSHTGPNVTFPTTSPLTLSRPQLVDESSESLDELPTEFSYQANL